MVSSLALLNPYPTHQAEAIVGTLGTSDLILPRDGKFQTFTLEPGHAPAPANAATWPTGARVMQLVERCAEENGIFSNTPGVHPLKP